MSTGHDHGGAAEADKRELLKRLLRERAAAAAREHPLSYNQRSIWFMNRLAPDSPAYNVPFVFRPLTPLDVEALRRVFRTLVRRHAILRTTYAAAAPVQRVAPDGEPDFRIVDAERWSEDDLWDAIADEAHAPFDLVAGPVLRVRVYVRAGVPAYLSLTLHHIAYDLWSMATLLNELRAIYRSVTTGEPLPAPPERQYADFVEWQARTVASADGDRMWAFWRDHLAGSLPVLALPADRRRPATQGYGGATCRWALPAPLVAAVRDLARAEGATLFQVLLAVYQLLLHGLSGQTDLIVGAPAAGRSRAEFEGLVGYFLNTLPIRSRVDADVAFRSFLQQVRQTVRGALDHQDFPVELMVERLRPTRSAGHSTLFQTLFVLNTPSRIDRQPPRPGDRGAFALERVPLDLEVSQFDLSLQVDQADDALTALWEYNTELYDAATVARWAERYERLLEAAVADPAARLSALLDDLARPAPDSGLRTAMGLEDRGGPAPAVARLAPGREAMREREAADV